MAVTSPYVLYVGSTAYDLRKVVSWMEPSPQVTPAIVFARFLDTPDTQVQFVKSTFEAAMQAAVNAS